MQFGKLSEDTQAIELLRKDRSCLLVTSNCGEEHHHLINHVEGVFGRLHSEDSLEQRHLFGKSTIVFEGYTEEKARVILNKLGLTKLPSTTILIS